MLRLDAAVALKIAKTFEKSTWQSIDADLSAVASKLSNRSSLEGVLNRANTQPPGTRRFMAVATSVLLLSTMDVSLRAQMLRRSSASHAFFNNASCCRLAAT